MNVESAHIQNICNFLSVQYLPLKPFFCPKKQKGQGFQISSPTQNLLAVRLPSFWMWVNQIGLHQRAYQNDLNAFFIKSLVDRSKAMHFSINFFIKKFYIAFMLRSCTLLYYIMNRANRVHRACIVTLSTVIHFVSY